MVVIQSSLSSYLFSIVYHRAINRIKQEEVKSRAENYFYEEMQSLIDEPNFYLIEELTTRIQEAVTALAESYKEAFVMHRFKNMSYKEIAGILGVSPKTIDYRIQQALKQLRIELKRLFALSIASADKTRLNIYTFILLHQIILIIISKT